MDRFDDSDKTKQAYGPGFRRIICVDFDNVLHRMERWAGPGIITGKPVAGAIEWLTRMVLTEDEGKRLFDVQIFSSRSKYNEGITAMRQWLIEHELPVAILDEIRFPTDKPPAWVLVDDRNYAFRGQFPTAQYILDFPVWTEEKFEHDSAEFLHWLADRLDGSLVTSQERRRIHRIANHLEGKHHEEMHKEPPP